ncbi:MAG TPA: M14 metallopeptidase family protein [Flavobacterium sp.]|jgi:hypothetical protein
MDFSQLFNTFKEQNISGRYIHLGHIRSLLDTLNTNGQVTIIGQSVLQNPVYAYQLGTGTTKILCWSQMHGNESTTTKALFDLFNFLNGDDKIANTLRSHFTFYFIPILNPDGAFLYTRENANQVDLNRDAQNLSQPESKILREVYAAFQPDYCFNLHDQRTIFGVGNTSKPATVSFLAPSYDEEKNINEVRKKAIRVINSMYTTLKDYIPGQIGRFDDSFNINCIGDTFQHLGTPTVLFEAGHYQNDYEREHTRKYVFIALLSGMLSIYQNAIFDDEIDYYMNIPQNTPNFFDFVYKNIKFNYDHSEIITNFALQYKEELIENKIFFNAFIIKIGELDNFFGHVEVDAGQELYSDNLENKPHIGQKADFCLGKAIKVINGKVVNDAG